MAHFIVEYSANIADLIKIPKFFEAIGEAAIATGVFPRGGVRVRGRRCDDYYIADGNPELCFVHVTIKAGAGRDLDTLKAAHEVICKTIVDHLQPIFDTRTMGITCEMVEIHPVLTFKQNNIHTYLASK